MEDYMDFDRFIQTYELQLDREFDHDHVVPSWAPSTQSRPSLWGEEVDTLLPSPSYLMSEGTTELHIGFAISPDRKIAAVTTNSTVQIYDVGSKMLTAELERHQEAIWVIHLWDVHGLGHKPTSHAEAHYMVVSQDADCLGADGVIICWYLDKEGRYIGNTNEPLNFEGRFINKDELTLSCDKRRFFHTDRSLSTQDWMRPSDWLPQIVIRSLSNPETELVRLKGHQDAIEWASWSPTDPNIIVSASSDKSICIWNATTSERIHNIPVTRQQNFTGDFSPDGQRFLCSGRNCTGELEIAIYAVETGSRIMRLGLMTLVSGSWDIPLSWCPSGELIALGLGQLVILWHIPTNTTTEILKLHSDGIMRDDYCQITSVRWIDRQGNKILVRVTDSTILVWDRLCDWKWRLQRPAGVKQLSPYSSAEVFDEGTGILRSLDGDGQVRAWTLG